MITALTVGMAVNKAREAKGLTQEDLALASGAGPRIISELEKGKETCQLGKVLKVINAWAINEAASP